MKALRQSEKMTYFGRRSILEMATSTMAFNSAEKIVASFGRVVVRKIPLHTAAALTPVSVFKQSVYCTCGGTSNVLLQAFSRTPGG